MKWEVCKKKYNLLKPYWEYIESRKSLNQYLKIFLQGKYILDVFTGKLY